MAVTVTAATFATAAAAECVANGDRCFAIEWRFFEGLTRQISVISFDYPPLIYKCAICRHSFWQSRGKMQRGRDSEDASRCGDHAAKYTFYRHSS